MRVNALRVLQRSDVPLYIFGVNGRLIHRFAAVRYAERNKDGILSGYQRIRVKKHIEEIASYLEQVDALLPNAIVVAFNETIRFMPLKGSIASEWGTFGRLEIPEPSPGETKPGFIIDGQQRVAAFAQLHPKRNLPVIVVGVSTSSELVQREQFVLVNKTKPLPRDLLNELLPHVQTKLPKNWSRRRRASTILESLRFDSASPFCGRIRGVGSSAEGCNISQATVLSVLEKSMTRGGILSVYLNAPLDDDTIKSAVHIVTVFFSGVRRVWPLAWEGTPRTSRLVHGVGIATMGALMDVVMPEVNPRSARAIGAVTRRVKKIEKRCAWTDGRWPVLKCAWNELQNTNQDKAQLVNYILSEYQRLR